VSSVVIRSLEMAINPLISDHNTYYDCYDCSGCVLEVE
jgi:hypothetical protein